MNIFLKLLCAVGGFAFGTLGAYINARISAKGVKADNVGAVMGTNAVRMLIDIVTLVLTYAAIRLFELPFTLTLIASALGLTVFGMIFLKRLTDKILAESKTKDGGE